MRGYKAFDKNLKCREFQFIVGKTFEHKGEIELCGQGFHFCGKFFDVYHYYSKETTTRICEVEALGEVKSEGDKSVTNKIKIIKELSHSEILALFMNNRNSGDWNSGDWNSGNRNSGDGNSGDWNSGDWNSGNRNSGYGNSGNRNSGDWNSGDGNSGDWNSGDWNSGNRNSGYGNSGDWNSGDWNSGNRNSGYGNSGNRNSGDWNSGDGNSGYFNTAVPVYFFNKPSTILYTQDLENKIRALNVKPIVTYTTSENMTEEEKTNNPTHKVTGGFLRKTDRMNWSHLTEEDKEFIKSLPNFDNEVFKVISNGMSLLDETIEVEHKGQTYKLDIKKAKELGVIK